MASLDISYINEFDNLEKDYDNFYAIEVTTVKLFFIYINKNNEIYHIKSENETLNNTYLTNERLLYLIKNNQYNLLNKHKLVSLLQFNIDLEHTDLKKFVLNEIEPNYLKSLKIIDTIKFNNSIKSLQDINSMFFIYTNIDSTYNTTKKIMLKPTKSKTRRKQISNIKTSKFKTV